MDGEEERRKLRVSWVPLVLPGLLGRGSGGNAAESSLAVWTLSWPWARPSWCLETEVELVWEELKQELPKQRAEADSSSPGSLLWSKYQPKWQFGNRTSGTELIWASRVPGQIERHLVLLEVAYPGSSKMPLQLPVSGVLYDLLPPSLPLLCLVLGLFGCGWPWSGHSPYPQGWPVASWSPYQAQAPGSASVPKCILGGE